MMMTEKRIKKYPYAGNYAGNYMDVHMFALYSNGARLSHRSGIYYFDGRSAAKVYRNLGKNAMYSARDRLVEDGWFIELEAPRRLPSGVFARGAYRVVKTADWVKEHTFREEQSGNTDQSLQRDRSPVLLAGTTSPNRRNDQSYLREQPVPLAGHSIVEKNFVEDSSVEERVEKKDLRASSKLGLRSSLSTGGHADAKNSDDILRMVQRVASTDIVFETRHLNKLSALRTEFGIDLLEAAFRRFYESALDDDFKLKRASQLFSDTARAYILAIQSEREYDETTNRQIEEITRLNREKIEARRKQREEEEANDELEFDIDDPPDTVGAGSDDVIQNSNEQRPCVACGTQLSIFRKNASTCTPACSQVLRQRERKARRDTKAKSGAWTRRTGGQKFGVTETANAA